MCYDGASNAGFITMIVPRMYSMLLRITRAQRMLATSGQFNDRTSKRDPARTPSQRHGTLVSLYVKNDQHE